MRSLFGIWILGMVVIFLIGCHEIDLTGDYNYSRHILRIWVGSGVVHALYSLWR